MTLEEYFREVNAGQKHVDRIIDNLPGDAKQAKVMQDLGVNAPPMVHPGLLGPTAHSAWDDPAVQRQHSMASPYVSGERNLTADRSYAVDMLNAAYEIGRYGHYPPVEHREMVPLGAALHAVEDSYSSAHLWRGDSVYSGDATAPIKSFNVFDAFGHGPMNTHDGRFDKALPASGSFIRR